MTQITELSSELSSDNTNDTSKLAYVKQFCKRMLKTQVFVGTFHEKRFIHHLGSYRHVIRVDSKEKSFIENLVAVKNKVRQEVAKDLTWIGITEPNTIGTPAGFSLWVVLPVEVFGKYWFKVKSVRFLPNEVRLELEILREFSAETSGDNSKGPLPEPNTFSDLPKQLKTNFSSFYAEYITFQNIKQSVIFISLLIGTILAGGVNLIKYLMEYTLKFIREFSGFIKVCTPIIITCLDLVRRTVYGMFAFIIALVHGGKRAPPPHQQLYPTTYFGNPRYMLQYPEGNRPRNRRSYSGVPYRSSVTIEPVDD